MSIEIKVPVFPESIAEGTIATWHKNPGDVIAEDDVIVEIETDKVVLEVPAMHDGVMGSQTKAEGDTVISEETIGSMEEGVAAAPAPVAEKATASATANVEVSADVSETNDTVTPAVRRLLAEHNLSADKINGTGKGGRLTVADVESYLKKPVAAKTAAPAMNIPQGERSEKRVPMTRLRKTIANRLLEVQQTNAILTTFNEVDMTNVMKLRKQYQDQFIHAHDVKLGFMSFFLKASVEALKKFPAVNGSIDGNDLVYHGFYDVGVAISTDRGLVVPVLRNVDQMSLADIEKAIIDFAQKGRAGKLSLDDLQGGTFTVTNGGTFGSMLSTPIINPPQSAILGMHNIVQRPMVVDGEIKARPIMYLALSYDHRIIDGRESVQFLKTIKELIEDPARILLSV